jgi:hypothetical protein
MENADLVLQQVVRTCVQGHDLTGRLHNLQMLVRMWDIHPAYRRLLGRGLQVEHLLRRVAIPGKDLALAS